MELLIAAGIAGVLASLALPAFQGLVLDGRRTAVVNDLVAALTLARAEAVSRRRPVVVCAVRDADADGRLDTAERACTGQDWSQGWIVGAWTDADADRAVDPGELTVLREHLAEPSHAIAVRAGRFTASPPVAPSGTAVMKPFARRSANGTLTVCDRRGAAHGRAIIVSGSGRTRVSSRTAGGQVLACP